MEVQNYSAIAVAYFMSNFTQGFIQECWGRDTVMANHLEEKFLGYSKNHVVGAGAFHSWFMELTEDNKDKLVSWIVSNYKGVDSLRQNAIRDQRARTEKVMLETGINRLRGAYGFSTKDKVSEEAAADIMGFMLGAITVHNEITGDNWSPFWIMLVSVGRLEILNDRLNAILAKEQETHENA